MWSVESASTFAYAAVAQPDDIPAQVVCELIEQPVRLIAGIPEHFLFGVALHAAERLGHAGSTLCRNRNKAPLVDIVHIIECCVAERPAVGSALDVMTGLFESVRAANGADLSADGAGNADLFLDARVDLTDEIGIAVGAHHIGICAEKAIRLPGFCRAFRVGADLGLKDACSLVSGFGVMVKDAGDADEALLQLRERRIGEAVAVAVDLVVAEDEVKEIDLIERMCSACKCVELLQQLFSFLIHNRPP